MNIQNLKLAIDKIPQDKLDKFADIINKYDKIIILGNGGSNAIAQHISQDYTKVSNKKAICFADASRLTCYINDYGQDYAYKEFLKDFADKDTLVILISSSGDSKNIWKCASYCISEKIEFIILTGFRTNNSLRLWFKDVALLDFWVDSNEYGVVEIIHEVFLHSIC